MKSLFLLPLLITQALAQIPLPTPFLPPNASAGAQPSSGGSPNPQWSTLLGNLLYFYEAQRSGSLPSSNRVKWRNDSAVHDGSDAGVDLSGGYYDAGDYIKCTYPLSFTVMSICWGATDFGTGYDAAKQTAYLDDMLRWSLDWLMKAHPQSSTLYVQVGNGDADNAYWGGDLNIPEPRTSYQINDTHPGTDAAAAASAAFSACSILYSNRTSPSPFSARASLQNASYASTLLTHAQQLYTFAAHASGGQMTYQKSAPAAGDAYPSSTYQDELTLAALFLAGAENSTQMFEQAEEYYSQFHLGGYDGVFNWDSKTPGLAVLFSQLAQSGLGGNMSKWQSEAERYFDNIVNKKGLGYLTNGGLLWYDGDSDSASLNPALNAAMLLTRYAPLATSSDKRTSYLNFAKTQVDYALGKNPMSAPYVVGSNPNSPSNPHSALASGGDDIGQINTVPAQEAYVLYGAVVGGPDKKDRFFDIRSDWVETEVALDFTAPLLTLAAMHVLNDTSDPFYTSLAAGEYAQRKPSGSPCDAAMPCGGPGLSKGGKIALGVVLGLVGMVIVGLGVTWILLALGKGGMKDQ